MGHRPRVKGGYFPVAPVDSAVDLRAEMVSTMMEMGLPCDKHHHEVAAAQHELGLTYGTLTTTADRMQVYKYVVHQVAHAYGKTATFMPKPIKDDNGSGMHTHLSIWNGSTPLFAGDGYAGLSGDGALLHRRHHPPRQGLQRLHQPIDQQLQAPRPRLRGPGPARLQQPQPQRRRAASRTAPAASRSASRSASPTRWPTPTSPTPRC